MKKNLFVKLGLALLIVAALSSCSLLSVSGRVINTRAASGNKASLNGALVELTGTAGQGKFSGTVDSSGNYFIDFVPEGTYTITVQKSGIIFIPETFTVSGLFVTAPDILGFNAPSENSLIAVLKWANTSRDLDFHAVIGADDVWTTNDGDDNPDHVYYDNKERETNGFIVELERDIVVANLTAGDFPIETITISDAAGVTAGPENVRFYVHSYSQVDGLTGGDSIAPARAKVYAIQYEASTEDVTQLGIWNLPTDTLETSLRVFSLDLNEVSGLTFNNLITDTVNPGPGVIVRSASGSTIGVPSEIK